MRLITFAGLVARRVWAKRGLLVGSLLGSAVVIALLVVVPLYESSVQAIDLRFTVRSAPSTDTRISAFVTTSDYSPSGAAANREVVARAHTAVAEWYPTVVERTQSRELIVIPTGGSVDWVAQGEAWKQEVEALRDAGTPDAELPPPPYPTPPQEATVTRLLTAPDLADRVTVVQGSVPASSPDLTGGDPIPAVLGADLARLVGQDVGGRFIIRPFIGGPAVFELVEVAAVVTAVDDGDPFWGFDDPGMLLYLPQEHWDTITVATPSDPERDPWGRAQRGLVSSDATQRWLLPFDPEALDLEEVDAVRSAIGQFRAVVSRDAGIAATSFLPQLLDAFDLRSVVVGQPILAILALVVGGALYFLIYTAALTLEREGPELALLKSRGASSWQTVGIHLAQAAIVAAVAAAIAPFVAQFLVAVTGRIPPMSDLTGGEALVVNRVRPIGPFLLAGAVITFVSMGLAILPFARRSILELRSLAARPARDSVWQRYNLDLFAIALSLVILFQLASRGFINAEGGEARLDPLAVIFPALLLFTGALVLLRILPWALRLVGWVMTKVRRLSTALPGWHLGRNPVPYGRLALLVWLTTGLGVFALTYANTLERSFDDRARFTTGADLRVLAEGVGYLSTPEGATASAGVLRTAGAPRLSSRTAEALAVRPDDFARVVAWRDDFGALTSEAALAPLRPDGMAPDLGTTLPDGTAVIRVDGVVVPRTLEAESRVGGAVADLSLRLLAKVFDANGRVLTVAADRDFVDDEWRTIEIRVEPEAIENPIVGAPTPPYTLHALWVERPAARWGNIVLSGDRVLLDAFRVVFSDGTEAPLGDLDDFTAVNDLTITVDTPADFALTEHYRVLPPGVARPSPEELAASPLHRDGTATLWSLPARTRVNPSVPQWRRLPDRPRVLLDREAAAASGLDLGEVSQYSVSAEVFEAELVGYIDRIPTMTDRRQTGKMILDFDAFNAIRNGAATWSFDRAVAEVDMPSELWVSTDDAEGTARRIAAQLPDEPDAVLTVAAAFSQFSGRPVQVGLVAILFVGAATGIALALAGVTGYVLLAVARRAREMGVLRALGFPRSGVAVTFAVEQLVVLGLGAVIGTLGGIGLMAAMVPFLQLGETADIIEPPVRLALHVPVLAGYLAVVAAVLVVSVVWATRRVSVRRMSEVLREVER